MNPTNPKYPTQIAVKPILDSFVRIEDKFIVPKIYEDALLKLLTSHLTPTYVDDATRFTLVESLYFDSDELDFFRDHFRSVDARYKIRIRRYAPNGVWANGVAFVEYKCKSRGVCTKERMQLDISSYERILGGEALSSSDALLKVNAGTKPEKLANRIAMFNDLIERYRARPRVSVTYLRHAFEGDGVRVTIDTGIKFKTYFGIASGTTSNVRREPFWDQAGVYGSKFSNETSIVVEVKHQNQRPAWLDNFMQAIGTGETSFSKYCWSLVHLIEEVAA